MKQFMQYPRGDVKKKERKALHAVAPRRRKEELAGGTTSYNPEET
jgi:hypothetical protein